MESTARIAVVGAGAAGLFCAIQAAKLCKSNKVKVSVFDSKSRIGAKILMSGGGRCNLTNRFFSSGDYFGGPAHFVRHVLSAYKPEQALDFFERIGVSSVCEGSNGKMFPVSQKSNDVLNALLKTALLEQIDMQFGWKINSILQNQRGFDLTIVSEGGDLQTQRVDVVIMCTGGLSYPQTGSDGHGLRIAEKLGHTLIKTHPALTPFLTNDEDFKALSGLSLPKTILHVFIKEKKVFTCEESFLFTHFGFSGTSVLNASRFYPAKNSETAFRVDVDMLFPYSQQAMIESILVLASQTPRLSIRNAIRASTGLADRLIVCLLGKISVNISEPVKNFSREKLELIIRKLKAFPIPISGVYGYKKAEVTAGGVCLSNVHHATMQSRKVPGLFFAGEILDVDGRIGGYNFQWAWSSAYVAAKGAMQWLEQLGLS